jgi:hypothetical protein
MTMNIIELMEHDHEKSLLLIDRLRSLSTQDPRSEDARGAAVLLDDLAELLRRHVRVAIWVLTQLLDADAGERAALGALRKDGESLARWLSALRAAGRVPGDGAWIADLGALERVVREHIVRVQQQVLSEARRVFDDVRLEWMFYEAERQKAHQSESDALIFPADHFGIP